MSDFGSAMSTLSPELREARMQRSSPSAFDLARAPIRPAAPMTSLLLTPLSFAISR